MDEGFKLIVVLYVTARCKWASEYICFSKRLVSKHRPQQFKRLLLQKFQIEYRY